MINTKQLKLSKSESGDEMWVCGYCGKREWPTLEEKHLQLAAYSQVLKK